MAHQFDAPLSPAETIIANRILAHLATQPEPPVNERTLDGIFQLFTHEIEQYLLRTPHGRREVTIQVEEVLHYLYHVGSITFDDERSFHYVQPDPHAIPPLNN